MRSGAVFKERARSSSAASPIPRHRYVEVPAIGIGAGRHCDAQVLVWQDMPA
jgi:ketopantoate hydroxymethyltransferase